MRLIPLFAMSLLFLPLSSASASISISVAPGASPAGYIPLDGFGGTTILPIGDEELVDLNVPSFTYATQSWSHVRISSNGYLVVGNGTGTSSDSSFENQTLPDPTAPNNVLAPFWTDLDGTGAPGILANVLTDGISSWLVVEWRLNLFGTSARANFQTWIGIDGPEDITFSYGQIPTLPGGFTLTVGAENVDGTVGANYFANGVGTLPSTTESLRVTTTGTLDPPASVPLPGAIVIWSGLMALVGFTRLGRN